MAHRIHPDLDDKMAKRRCGTREGPVTMGRRASKAARQWLVDNRYQDYLYLDVACAEMAEAFAEHSHERIHDELRFASEEAC